MTHLLKAQARFKLDTYVAVSMAQSIGDGRDEWVDNMERLAGYKHS